MVIPDSFLYDGEIPPTMPLAPELSTVLEYEPVALALGVSLNDFIFFIFSVSNPVYSNLMP